jgi:hypothetical protein
MAVSPAGCGGLGLVPSPAALIEAWEGSAQAWG